MCNQYHQSRKPPFYFVSLALVTISFFAAMQPATRVIAAPATAQSTPATTIKLSDNGKALLPIVISAQAGEREKSAAQSLAEYLQRISGGEFKIETLTTLGASTPGIAVGVASRFAPLPVEFKTSDPRKSEDYLLRSHAGGVLLIGASEAALEYAVWDFLYRLGYRQFFPGKNWEIVPHEANLSLAVNVIASPAYNMRVMNYGGNTWAENRIALQTWKVRNRMGAGIVVSTGHNYGNIIRRHPEEFAAHPEYLAQVGGARVSPTKSDAKFCISNPGLRRLVVDDALAQFAGDASLQSYSVEPSDGGNWCECPNCAALGSISDQQVTLANAVATTVDAAYPKQKYIGMYAYNLHSPPPKIEVHPRVVVSIATSFLSGGYTVDRLMAGWSAKGATLGVREYWSVQPWDRDLPGKARISNSEYLKTTIPHFHEQGARFYRTEAGDNWGPYGLGYYLAARMLWDTGEAAQVGVLTDDFLQKSFGSAREPMAEFYRLIDGSHKPLLSSDLIGRLYRQLDKALQSTPDAAVTARLRDLALYVRYVEMYSEYSQATGAARQSAFENMLRFAWRIRGTYMIHSLALWGDLDKRDNQIKIPAGATYRIPEPQNPWKKSGDFTAVEIQDFIANGIANNKILEFEPVSFSNDLVPATKLNLASGKRGQFVLLRGNWNLYTWVEKSPQEITLQVSAGQIYPNRGPAKFELFPLAEPEGNSVAKGDAAPDKQPHDVTLKTSFEGLHRISGSDSSGGTTVTWREGMPLVFESSLDEAPVLMGGYWSLYFYVPKGTRVLGGYRTSVGRILGPDGKTVLGLGTDGAPGFWSVPVPAGQDGKLWQFVGKGQLKLMTTPPYLARSAQELLLPREVVEADATP
jgi:hypothetical protein